MAYMGKGHCLECGYDAEAEETMIEYYEKELKVKDQEIERFRNEARTLSKMIGNMKKHLKSTYWEQFVDYDI
tara:strand:- start:36643 stop:36858 length:216 start_codon:yes stop_codon:yes gene_type:complete